MRNLRDQAMNEILRKIRVVYRFHQDNRQRKRKTVLCIAIISATCWLLPYSLLRAQLMSEQAKSEISVELKRIKSSLNDYAAPSEKMRFLQNALAQSRYHSVRAAILGIAETIGDDEYELLLIDVVKNDFDTGLRISAVKKLAQCGTFRSVQPLLECARNDPTGDYAIGCIIVPKNARRDALLTLAELGRRLPTERDRITRAVREIPVESDYIRDATTIALYILTGEESLLCSFYERLWSKDQNIHLSAMNDFHLMKLKHVPSEIAQLVHDPDQEVRRWATLLLGEIGDPESIPLLMDTAHDKKVDQGIRCNAIYSLGLMRAIDAKVLLEELLLDQDVTEYAAFALSQITRAK